MRDVGISCNHQSPSGALVYRSISDRLVESRRERHLSRRDSHPLWPDENEIRTSRRSLRLHMLSLRLGLLLLRFISAVRCELNVTSAASPTLSIPRCRDGWHYLDDDATCIRFATSAAGDVPWYDGYKACATSSSELLTVSNSQQIEQIHRRLESHQSAFGMAYLQRSAWIGKASKIGPAKHRPHLRSHLSRMVRGLPLRQCVDHE